MNYWKISFAVLGLLTLYLCFYFLNKITKMERYGHYVSEHAVDLNMKESFYHLNFELDAHMTGAKAPDIQCMENKIGETLLSILIKDRPRLIYRYADINCNTCYEAELTHIAASTPPNVKF